jgi:hypothetical protein
MTSLVFASGIVSLIVKNNPKCEDCTGFQKKCCEDDGESDKKSLDDETGSSDNLDDYLPINGIFLSQTFSFKSQYPPLIKSAINGYYANVLIPPPNY